MSGDRMTVEAFAEIMEKGGCTDALAKIRADLEESSFMQREDGTIDAIRYLAWLVNECGGNAEAG